MFGEASARLLWTSETAETPQTEEAWTRAHGKRAVSFGKHGFLEFLDSLEYKVIGSRERKLRDECGESPRFIIRRLQCKHCEKIHHER
ncbi:DUF6431 domain-containing protein [Planococcus sp. ISL-109]|uniref:DUF6431 domain-containing protein n=1 Tax=Planococcus sp. ISL-109 TaxID=2819166 RepID=UPI0033366D2B